MTDLEQAKYNAWTQFTERWLRELEDDKDKQRLIAYMIEKLKEIQR